MTSSQSINIITTNSIFSRPNNSFNIQISKKNSRIRISFIWLWFSKMPSSGDISRAIPILTSRINEVNLIRVQGLAGIRFRLVMHNSSIGSNTRDRGERESLVKRHRVPEFFKVLCGRVLSDISSLLVDEFVFEPRDVHANSRAVPDVRFSKPLALAGVFDGLQPLDWVYLSYHVPELFFHFRN